MPISQFVVPGQSGEFPDKPSFVRGLQVCNWRGTAMPISDECSHNLLAFEISTMLKSWVFVLHPTQGQKQLALSSCLCSTLSMDAYRRLSLAWNFDASCCHLGFPTHAIDPQNSRSIKLRRMQFGQYNFRVMTTCRCFIKREV